MDIFGIGTALKALQEVYFRSGRSSGRTMAMVSALKTGDLVCFTQQREANRVKKMCEERGVTIDVIVVDPNHPERLMERGTAKERFVFDHSWVEQYYQRELEESGKRLKFFTERLTGFGEAHLETRRKAEELARWRG